MDTFVYPDQDLRFGDRPVATLGNFDGVHLGHQGAIEQVLARANELGVPSVVVTFEPHPVSVLRPEMAPRRILSADQKTRVVASYGINRLVTIRFTDSFSQTEPPDFVSEFLVSRLGVSELVLGANFRFGRSRSGDLESLSALGAKFGFRVHTLSPSLYEGSMISSSRIRQVLASGELEKATAMMGRAYFVEGTVIRGDGRGRPLGFPTANLDLLGDLLVDDGVYVTSTEVDGHKYKSMTHLGTRPTFGVNERAVETHLLGYDGDLYGSTLKLSFYSRIRGTIAFDSPDQLVEQLERDRAQVLGYFAEPGRNLGL